MPVFFRRIFRAARMDPAVYDEIGPDKPAPGQALTLVILSAIAAGTGNLRDGGIPAFLTGSIVALAGWFLWILVSYFTGTRLVPGHNTRPDFERMLTFAGFASAPGLARVLEVIPGIRSAVFLITAGWMIAATVIGIRQALRYRSTLRAAGVCISGWFIQVIVIGAVIYFLQKYAGLVPHS